jgi:hypothetical protein
VTLMQARAMEAPDAEPKREPLGEYYLYSVEGAHDLRNGETRGVVLLAPRAVKTEPRYLYNGQRLQGVRTQLEVENKKESGLGAPLAGGRVRFYQRNAAGDLVFTGEDRLAHTAVDEKRTLDVGVAFDLVGERRVLADRRLSDREREQTVEVKLRNRKAQPVTIVVEETLHGDVEIVRKSHDFTRKDANTIEFRIPVPAGQEVRVEYAARMRW